MDTGASVFSYEYYSAKLSLGGELNVSGPVPPSDLDSFSFTVWFYVSDLNTKKSCLFQQDGIDMGIDGDKLYCFWGGMELKSTEGIISGTWNHAALVIYESTAQLFINGARVAQGACSGAKLLAGKSMTLGEDFFGYMRNATLYNTALMTDEIMSKMYLTDTGDNVLFCYDFTSNPPMDKKSGKKLSLGEKASIVRMQPTAVFYDSSYFLCRDEGSQDWFHPDRPFTVQAWINFQPDGQDQYALLSCCRLRDYEGFELTMIKESDGYRVGVYMGSMNVPAFESKSLLNTSVWQNLALCFDGEYIQLYLDGVLKETSAKLETDYFENDSLLIGARATWDFGGENWFSGCVSQLDIWDHALSQTEIADNLNEMPEPTENGLYASFSFVQEGVQNLVTGMPLGKINGAGVYPKELAAPRATQEPIWHRRQRLLGENLLPDELLAQSRKDSGILDQLKGDGAKNIVLFSSVVYESNTYFIRHDIEGSCPVSRLEGELDSKVQWWIELILIIIDSILGYFLSLKISYSESLARFIRQNLLTINGISKLMLVFAAGTDFSITMIFSLVKEIAFSGKLMEILRIACREIGFWTLVSFVGGFARRLIGGAASLTLWLGVTLTKVLIHVRNYPSARNEGVSLQSITFNHREPRRICSINIMKNEAEQWMVPEWQRDRPANDNLSPAVYRLARFDANDDKLELKVCLSTVNNTRNTKSYSLRCDGGDVFGMSQELNIQAPPGEREQCVFFAFPEAGNLLKERGIDRMELALNWQIQETPGERSGLGVYQPITGTRHIVYTILDSVQLPWGTEMQREESALKLVLPPMTTVYDETIAIVRGMRTTADVQKAVTSYIYTCGKFKYAGNAQIVAIKRINSEQLLRALCATPNCKYSVNCEDCSALIQAISNIYGCNTRCLYIGNNFKVNPILFIGETQMRPPDTPNNTFEYHCLITDRAYVNPDSYNICYDACMMYTGNVNQTLKLAIAEPFRLPNGTASANYDTYLESICPTTQDIPALREAPGFYFLLG